MTAGFLFDKSFKNHICQYSHPECPERLDAVLRGFEQLTTSNEIIKVAPRFATHEELKTVHKPRYITSVLDILSQTAGNLDADTFFSKGTKDAALNAAGGGIDLAKMVHSRKADWGFAAVRPPGHHATPNEPCGFCIFNNIAVATSALLKETKAQKIAIFDWDVHHGNGTQDQFWNNPNVLFVSMHQSPHFPGSGLANEIGGPDALGKTINFPFPPNTEDSDFISVIDRIFIPVVKEFAPDHILISAGFDAHKLDYLSDLQISTKCYGIMAAKIKLLANEMCNGRLTLFLEGGYNLKALEDSTRETVLALNAPEEYAKKSTNAPSVMGSRIINSTIKKISSQWKNITF